MTTEILELCERNKKKREMGQWETQTFQNNIHALA